MARTKKQSLEKVSERKRQIRLEIQKESLKISQAGANGMPTSSSSSNSHSCNGNVAMGATSADQNQSTGHTNQGF